MEIKILKVWVFTKTFKNTHEISVDQTNCVADSTVGDFVTRAVAQKIVYFYRDVAMSVKGSTAAGGGGGQRIKGSTAAGGGAKG